MLVPSSAQLYIAGVSTLIAFLGYSSQYLFRQLQPDAALNSNVTFNVLLGCVCICYYRACFTDPGRIPKDWVTTPVADDDPFVDRPKRWCKKCEAPKPPRAHHCKVCGRCIPKMDHHCPWTSNCVSETTFPHFLRFLAFAVVAMAQLEYMLYLRAAAVWESRHWPSYLGPTLPQLVHLFILLVANFMTLFAVLILFLRTVWSLLVNTTTIEGWEIDRHRALLRRAKVLGGYVHGPGGTKVKIAKQEFPYDVGFWKNCKQGMGGTGNVISWVFPFAASPSLGHGFEYEVNGFEDPSLTWPPPDPDRMSRHSRQFERGGPFVYGDEGMSNKEAIAAFRRRQQADFKRWRGSPDGPGEQSEQGDSDDEDERRESSSRSDGEEPWTNVEGERLVDFGVDEETEVYEADDVPIAELLRRRVRTR